MAYNVQARGSKHQLRVTHRLLPKPFFFTFDDEMEANNYGAQLQALLERGIVPAELLVPDAKGDDPLLVEVIRAYTKNAPITDSDEALLGMMLEELVAVRVSRVTFQWVDSYVLKLKTERNLAPGTIRKRVGALGRVIDWHIRRVTPQGATPPANALRLLPRGYSNYSRKEAEQLDEDKGQVVKRDESRDLRLPVDEERKVMDALAGVKRPDRERALQVDPALTMLLQLILDTGLRLREAYRLRVDQVDLTKRVIHVEGSKGHRGVIKPRLVPIKPALMPHLVGWMRGRVGLMFPFWSGDASKLELTRASGRLSKRFSKLFEYAGVPDLTEHDLRHEATCRWVELRNPQGGWIFSDIEICRIMGWTNTNMMLRYASLRGEDLAARFG